MTNIQVTKTDGTKYLLTSYQNGSGITKAEQKMELMGVNTVTIAVKSREPLALGIGDKINVFGETYTLNNLPKITEAGGLYSYDMTFEGMAYMMRNAILRDLDAVGYSTGSEFDLQCDLTDVASLVARNMTRATGLSWTLVNNTTGTTETRNKSFQNENCLAVIQQACTDWDKEFRIYTQAGAHFLQIADKGGIGELKPYSFAYGAGRGLYEFTREYVESSLFTRLFVFGSQDNIPSDYRDYSRRLKMPVANGGADSVLEVAGITNHIEAVQVFEDIKPHRKGTVTGKTAYNVIQDSGMFDLNAKNTDGETLYLLAGTSALIHFNTGNLAGYEFEVTKYDHATHSFTLKAYLDDRGQQFPAEALEVFQPNIGDEYVILQINLPQSYIDAAEAELYAKGLEFFNDGSQQKVKFTLKLDELFLMRQNPGAGISAVFQPGDIVNVKSARQSIDSDLRINSLTRDVLKPYAYTLEINDEVKVSIAKQVIEAQHALEVIIAGTKIADPAKKRRDWKTVQELITMIDTVKAEALLVGNDPAAQYQLTGTVVTPNYSGNANNVNITAGTLVHNVYPEQDGGGVWNFNSMTTVLSSSATPYYIYIKASKTAATAIIIYSATKIEVEAVSGYYHFPLGIISSVIQGVRTVNLIKGYTLITGDSIKTGTITNADGSIIINLTDGTITGKIIFKNTDGTTNTLEEKFVTIQMGWNMVRNSNFVLDVVRGSDIAPRYWEFYGTGAEVYVNNQKFDMYRSQGALYIAHKSTTEVTGIKQWINFERNQHYAISFKSMKEVSIRNARNFVEFYDNTTLVGSAEFAYDYTKPDEIQVFYFHTPDVSVTHGYFYHQAECVDVLGGYLTNLGLIKVEHGTSTGTTATAWTQALEDIGDPLNQALTDAQAATEEIDNITSDNVLSKAEKSGELSRWNDILSERTLLETKADGFGITTEKTNYETYFQYLANYLNGGTTWTTGTPAWLAALGENTNISGSVYRGKWNAYYLRRQTLINALTQKAKDVGDAAQQTANTANATANAAAGVAAAAKATTDAIENRVTIIDGGLVLTTLIQMIDSTSAVTAGMYAGDPEDPTSPAFWAGGTMAQAIEKTAKFVVSQNGDLRAANGNLVAKADGGLEVSFTTPVTRYTSTGGSEIVNQTIKISQTSGEISISTSDYETAQMTSQGIIANKAGQQALPVSTGIELKGAIVGLGFGDLAADAYTGLGSICGVYGSAENSNANPAPAYGGYFNRLKANGLYLSTRTTTGSTTLTQQDTILHLYHAANGYTITMPATRYKGQTVFIRVINSYTFTLSGNGAEILLPSGAHATSHSSIGTKGELITLTWDGSYWVYSTTLSQ